MRGALKRKLRVSRHAFFSLVLVISLSLSLSLSDFVFLIKAMLRYVPFVLCY